MNKSDVALIPLTFRVVYSLQLLYNKRAFLYAHAGILIDRNASTHSHVELFPLLP